MILYDDYDDGGFEALQEAYKGKSKKLLELENMIGKSREKYFNTFKVGGAYYTDPDFIKIGDKIASIFNFKVVDFNIINDPAPNACTIPVGFCITKNSQYAVKCITTKGENMKYEKGMFSAFIRVTSGIWTNQTFTHGEVTAIILHEVGHNFQDEINSVLKYYAAYMYFLKFFTAINAILTGVGAPAGIYSLIMGDSELRGQLNIAAKTSGVGKFVEFGSVVVGFIRMILYEILEIAGRLTLGIPTGLISMSNIIVGGMTNPIGTLIDLAMSGIGKGAENISDTFASDLGYGPELISALTKMELDPEVSATSVGRFCRKVPVFDSVCTMFALPLVIVDNMFEAHPITPKRVSNVVRDIESQMDKDYVTPKMRKEMQMQIDEIKKCVDEYTKVDSPLEGQALRKAIFKFNTNYDRDPKGFLIQAAASKKDLSEMANEYIEQEFQDIFDDLY